MSNLSDFLGGGKPKLITRYTSGTGTYVPTVDNARCLVRVQGAGGGGAIAGSGAGGAFLEAMLRIPISGIAYVVGAGGAGVSGTTAAAGGLSSAGQIVAPGGNGGYYNGTNFYGADGGLLAQAAYSTNVPDIRPLATIGLSWVAGGCGGALTNPQGAIGNPIAYNVTGGSAFRGGLAYPFTQGRAAGFTNYWGGGDSYMGVGGAGSNASNGSNGNGYGSGGGAAFTGFTGGNGASGCIEIWDFGA